MRRLHQALIIFLIAFLFALGIAIGQLVHTLELIKNEIMHSPENAYREYRAPVAGVKITLAYLWDLSCYMIVVSFILTCKISILLGFMLWRSWGLQRVKDSSRSSGDP